jgi:hypothetical protein
MSIATLEGIEDVFNSKRWADHSGKMNISCSSGHYALVLFAETSMFKKDKRRDVAGSIFSGPSAEKAKPKLTFNGKWNTTLTCPELKETLFTAPQVADLRVKEQFGFSEFTCNLNALPAEGTEARTLLPQSDCRFRPDQRMCGVRRRGVGFDGSCFASRMTLSDSHVC